MKIEYQSGEYPYKVTLNGVFVDDFTIRPDLLTVIRIKKELGV